MLNTLVSLRSMAVTALILALSGCGTQKFSFAPGMIGNSVVFDKMFIKVDISSDADSTYYTVYGDDIEIDFNHTVIDGRVLRDRPDTFKGVAIHVYDSKNVTIKNLTIHGFKIAILAENVENLKIINCNLSYNYRPRMYSKWDRESLTDWLYYHNNEDDEWKRYGAAIYLKNCNNALVKDITCRQGMNALLMTGCNNALVYNNDFSYNSGLGIGLYRSSYNKIMHNKLDWNARGYSHGKYARGQDSSAILLYEQSSHNTFAYNSGTHSGDGLFLWAGQSTMDTGLGGCDSNLIYRNDFSHSIANGIEVTFSSNFMLENKLNDSRYGVWGGYSHHSVISGNEIIGCDYGIAIEHGSYNLIEGNKIVDCPIGVQLWQRASQPADWPYAQVRDVRSRCYAIENNQFVNAATAVEASVSDSVGMFGNTFKDVKLKIGSPRGASQFITTRQEKTWSPALPPLPEPLSDGMQVELPTGTLRGREYIIVNEWGPYDFQYPNLVLRKKQILHGLEELQFATFGPQGSWKVTSSKGFASVVPVMGAISDTLVARRHVDSTHAELVLEYTGDEFITQFGDTVRAGKVYPLRFTDPEMRVHWDVVFFMYDTLTDPLLHPENFSAVLAGDPRHSERTTQIAYRWWGSPRPELSEDQFAIRATADIGTDEGDYTFTVESDDGIRLWMDGVLILERWDVHTPIIDEVTIPMTAGRHHVELEYFEATGLAVLDVTVKKN